MFHVFHLFSYFFLEEFLKKCSEFIFSFLLDYIIEIPIEINCANVICLDYSFIVLNEKDTEGKAVVETAGNIPFSDVSDEFCRNTDYLGDENSPETMNEIKFSFNSEYAEQDIHEALEEIFPDKTAVKSTKLLSRVRIEQRSAVHDCILVLEVADPDTFVWPKLKGVDVDVFKEIKRIKK